MAMAPMDGLLRTLAEAGFRVGPRYLPRLAAMLGASALSTVVTLPERVATAALRPGRPWGEGDPEVVLVLGYYRSGTTHLHYLLACDPALATPRWAQVMAPQGFALSWALLRVFLIPFMGATRPQDDMRFGPEWPAEDDFATCNWAGASAQPGRMVFPEAFARFARYHDLSGLSAAERGRWERCLRAFCRKVAWTAPGRQLLLKSPSHTARLEAVLDLFGADRVRCVHVIRDPRAVIASNIALIEKALSLYGLQDPPAREVIEARIVSEYEATVQACARARARLGDGRFTEVRHEDVAADPHGSLAKIYGDLGLVAGAGRDRNLDEYLNSVREYRARTDRAAIRLSDASEAAAQRIAEATAWEPRRAPAAERPTPREAGAGRRWPAWVLPAVAAAGWAGLWVGIAIVTRNRHDWLIWPGGVAIGLAAWLAVRMGGAGRGRAAVGVWAAALTAAVLLATAWPNSRYTYYAKAEHPAAEHVWETTRQELTNPATLFWAAMGMVTAWRFGSRDATRAPGTGRLGW